MKRMKNSERVPGLSGELEAYIFSVLRTYSNIHRGSGYNSSITTELYSEARKTILKHMGLSPSAYNLIFCSPRRASLLVEGINPRKYRILSGSEANLPLGMRAVALRKGVKSLNISHFSGGGTARLVSPGWTIWSDGPERYESGTPAIINILAFAKALALSPDQFNNTDHQESEKLTDEEEVLYGEDLLRQLRGKIIGSDLEVPTIGYGKRKYINLDNAASTRTFAPVWESFRRTLGMSHEEHRLIIEESRKTIAAFTGAGQADYDIIFTSNTTESISLVAESLSKEHPGGTFVANTILEHNSNELPWRSFNGLALLKVNTDKRGIIDISGLERMLSEHNTGNAGKKRIALVTVSGASNVLGTCNDLEAVSQVTHRYGARLMVDAAQLIAHRSIDVNKLTIDYLAFSGHKIYAPFGTGVLIARKGLLSFSPDELSEINSSGEENAAGIAALGKSISLLGRIGMEVIQKEEEDLITFTIESMKKVSNITLFGLTDPDSSLYKQRCGVISFLVKDKLAWKTGESLSQNGIGVRTGCHCAHILVKYILDIPPFLEKFQGFILRLLPKLSLPGIVRISLGIENDRKDIELFMNELRVIASR